jgi:hypothetical protein
MKGEKTSSCYYCLPAHIIRAADFFDDQNSFINEKFQSDSKMEDAIMSEPIS